MPLHPTVSQFLADKSIDHEVVDCDPELADTADFCAHYNYSPSQSANALLVASTKGEPKQALCLVLATCRLDVNKAVRKKMGVRRLSFANPDDTKKLTGMELGGVTPFALPDTLQVLVDSRVMSCREIIVGGGNRESKILMPPDGLLKIANVEVVEDLAFEMS